MSTNTFDFTKCKELQLSRKSFMPRAPVAQPKSIFSYYKRKTGKVLISYNWCYNSWIKSNIYYICELGSIYLIQAYSKLENTRSKYSAKGQESYKIKSTLKESTLEFISMTYTIICNWKWQTVLSRPQSITYCFGSRSSVCSQSSNAGTLPNINCDLYKCQHTNIIVSSWST